MMPYSVYMTTNAQVITPRIEPLTAADRCDRCGAKATIAVKVRGDAESKLLFCGHHTMQYKDGLKVQALIIWDWVGNVAHDKTSLRARA